MPLVYLILSHSFPQAFLVESMFLWSSSGFLSFCILQGVAWRPIPPLPLPSESWNTRALGGGSQTLSMLDWVSSEPKGIGVSVGGGVLGKVRVELTQVGTLYIIFNLGYYRNTPFSCGRKTFLLEKFIFVPTRPCVPNSPQPFHPPLLPSLCRHSFINSYYTEQQKTPPGQRPST